MIDYVVKIVVLNTIQNISSVMTDVLTDLL